MQFFFGQVFSLLPPSVMRCTDEGEIWREMFTVPCMM